MMAIPGPARGEQERGERRLKAVGPPRSARAAQVDPEALAPAPPPETAPLLLGANLSRNLALVADVVAVVTAVVVTWLHWRWLNPAQAAVAPLPLREVLLHGRLIPPVWLVLPIWVAVFDAVGLYDPHNNVSTPKILQALSKGMAGVVIGVIVAAFLLDSGVSRLSVGLFALYGLLTSATLRVAVFLFVQSKPWRGVAPTRIAVLGMGAEGAVLASKLKVYRRLGYEFAGFIDDHLGRDTLAMPIDGGILGPVEDIQRIVNDHQIHHVVITDNGFPRDDAMDLALILDRMGVAVSKVPYLWGTVASQMRILRIGDLDLIHFRRVTYTRLAERLKRAFDVVVVLLASPVLVPLMVAVALAVKLDSRGPVFFIDRRYGRGGRAFSFFKFRSMVANAAQLREKLDAQNETDGLLFKMRDDPRITRVGRFIRKTSLDELPQFINVLLGDMNLVGPRPLPVRDFAKMELDRRPEWEYWYQQRCNVKPGITCLWQVMGRSDVGFDRMVELDIYYIENWSLWMDLQLLVKTVPVVLFSKGAR